MVKVRVDVQLDRDLSEKAYRLFIDLGADMDEAISHYLQRCVDLGRVADVEPVSHCFQAKIEKPDENASTYNGEYSDLSYLDEL